MSVAVGPHDLSSSARDLLRADSGVAAGVWSRAAAVLARQSIELSLTHLWQLRAPGLQYASTLCQLLCLPTLLGDAHLGGRVHLAWDALSAALHHHPYELAPTHAELLGWIETSWDLAEAVSRVHAEAGATRATRATR